MSKVWQIRLFVFSIGIHLLFYISSHFTHWLDILYQKINVGQDFFQIPNAAYAFLHGGTLTGLLPQGVAPYIACCGVNSNVYHPFFTLLIGFPLQLLAPWDAFAVWIIVHLMVACILLFFLWKNFRHHRYLYLALSIFLLNSFHYYEIWHAQYHFLFVLFTVLFLYEIVKKGDTSRAGLWLLCSLLVKPIGLLFIIPLLLSKKYRSVLVGFGGCAVITATFSLFPFGQYYLANIFKVSASIIPATHNIYALGYFFPFLPLISIHYFSLIVAIAILILQIIKKPPLFLVLSLWICFQLLFYPMVYPYQMTILAGVFCLGVLLNYFSPKSLIMIPIILLTLPSTIIFYHLQGITKLPPIDLASVWLYSIIVLVWLFVAMIKQCWRIS